MSFGAAVKSALRQYVTFSGRARRSEFWWFLLFANVVVLVASVVDRALGNDLSDDGSGLLGLTVLSAGTGVVGGIVVLALLLPYLAVSVRRLHDTDRRGWWVLIGIIPLIGTIVLLVFYVGDSTRGGNRFGPSPKRG